MAKRSASEVTQLSEKQKALLKEQLDQMALVHKLKAQIALRNKKLIDQGVGPTKDMCW